MKKVKVDILKAAAATDDSSDGDDSSKRSNSHSDDSSDAGIQSGDDATSDPPSSSKKKKRDRDEDEKSKDTKEPQPKDPMPPPLPPKLRKGKGKGKDGKDGAPDKPPKGDRNDTLLTNSQKSLDLVLELTPNVLWKSLVRANELDRRLGKVQAAEREMQKLMANDRANQEQKERAQKLQSEILAAAEVVSSMKQLFLQIRSTDTSLEQEMVSGQDLTINLAKCSDKLFADAATTMDVIHVMAKRLIDVPLL